MTNFYGGGNSCCTPSCVPSHCRPHCGPVAPIEKKCDGNGFLLLLLLFILLAGGPCLGVDTRFFFIIILAIIAFGGFGRTFGVGSIY